MKPNLSTLKLDGLDLSFLPPALLGRLAFRHSAPAANPLPRGRHWLGMSKEKDTLLFVPDGLDATRPVALLVLFHGASGSAESILPFFLDHASAHQFLLLVPQSTLVTWDLSLAGHGPDLDCLERSLSKVATHFPLDPGRLGFAGFSDGGSYALSTGLSNGDLVSHILALSAGFMNVYKPVGKPAVFIAHSPEDEQLSIKTSGRKHVSILQEAHYDVDYLEFSGPHVILPSVVEKAIAFFLTKDAASFSVS